MSKHISGQHKRAARDALYRALSKFNSGSELATALGLSRQIVHRWIRRGYVSVAGAVQMHNITDLGVTREALRPDIRNWKRYL